MKLAAGVGICWSVLVSLALADEAAKDEHAVPRPAPNTPTAGTTQVPEASRGASVDADSQALGAKDLCPWHLRVDGDWIPYCRNLRLGPRRTHIRRAVIVLHGKNRNAREYYAALERIATAEGALSSTMLLAPQFTTQPDLAQAPRRHQLAYWSRDGWKSGHRALNGQRTSSFEVIDRILKRLVDQNPNLQQIVIAGHSAGAQFAQRHAASRHVDMQALGVPLRYVVANPGSYMYLSRRRPGSTADCPETFNDYMYGADDNAVQYFEGLGLETLKQRFAQHPVHLLLGNRDTDPNDTDSSCEARAQGAHRFERGQQFFAQLSSEQAQAGPNAITYKTSLHVINDVGHDFSLMFDSKCGRSVLFGDGRCPVPASFAEAKRTPQR